VFPGLPQASFFRPSAYKDWAFERAFYRRAYSAATVVHLTHGDCMDGATCDVLVRRAYGDGAVETVFLEPHETADALELLTRVPSRARGLVVSDLSLQQGEGERVAQTLQVLADDGWRIAWRDHHHKQWEGVDLRAFEPACMLTLDTEGKESGASLVQKALLPDDPWARDLAAVARDHDLWLRQDPRSMTLFHAIVEIGTQRWVRHLLTRKPEGVVDRTLEAWAARDRRRNRQLVDWGLRRARILNGRRGKVGLVYGRVPTNEALHALEGRGADLSILVKPTGAFSLRSRREVPVCHRIAQQFGGGGHPNASGGRLGLGGMGLAALWSRRLDHRAVRALAQQALAEVDAHLDGRAPPSPEPQKK
jgi:oligoribonuclease NrnB/cAMP/cGMP phosphodiesterase (DHH superfamily)